MWFRNWGRHHLTAAVFHNGYGILYRQCCPSLSCLFLWPVVLHLHVSPGLVTKRQSIASHQGSFHSWNLCCIFSIGSKAHGDIFKIRPFEDTGHLGDRYVLQFGCVQVLSNLVLSISKFTWPHWNMWADGVLCLWKTYLTDSYFWL